MPCASFSMLDGPGGTINATDRYTHINKRKSVDSAQNMNYWRDLVNEALNPQVP